MFKTSAARFLLVSFFWTVMVLAYGVIRHPAAPIRKFGDSYVDKLSRPSTREDYENFRVWLPVFVVSGAVTALAMVAAVLEEKRQKREG